MFIVLEVYISTSSFLFHAGQDEMDASLYIIIIIIIIILIFIASIIITMLRLLATGGREGVV